MKLPSRCREVLEVRLSMVVFLGWNWMQLGSLDAFEPEIFFG